MRRRPERGLAFVVAGIFAAAIAYDLWHIPVQVSDSLTEILEAQGSASAVESFTRSLRNVGYLRPLRIAQIKIVFDLSQGHYTAAYRGVHVALVVALVWLFVRALRVESGADLAAAVFAITVLTGLHTFLAFVREAFPINHFLEIAVASVAVVNLAQSRGGWWVDVAAALLFAIAALTLESGVLVWVVIAAAWMTGLRGISGRGVAATTGLLLAYVALRFWVLETGVPSLNERSANFFLERLEPEELERRFGDGPLVFYAYNVVASVMSVLFTEPRDGMLVGLRAWRAGDVPPWVYLGIGSSAALTLAIVGWAIARWRHWRRSDPPGVPERLVVIAGAVLLASAALSFAYTKDEIMAIAGVFYAFAAYGTARAVAHGTVSLPPRRLAAASAVLLVVATAWAIRSFSVHHVLRRQAFRTRNDWAYVARAVRQGRWPDNSRAQAIIEQLTTDAFNARVPNARMVPAWERWLGE